MQPIHVARHGQTAYNAQGRFQGWLPVPLDATGRAQAARLAETVAAIGPGVLVTSHLARAQETAAIVGERLELEPVVDERFAETDAGAWADRTFAEVATEDPSGFASFLALDLDWGFPGGERFADQQARVLEGLADWRGRTTEGPVLIVAHGNVIRLALQALGRVVADRPDNAIVIEL